ncbi:DoxX-like family protein [Microbulbifer agarilyticus]|uniref:DoxX-like family protein n=1 Tax=Microbulbifer agarilyticus TaxID=260552 RepID=UPI001C95C269|nr:DoxX-like family protein [Microbulbifer agarilyticus]MBY6188801.1 DoxX-like family protein [Microbulbifer agarilyticus]
MSINQICRWTIGGCWIYHGIIPKLFTIAPLEQQMMNRLGFGVQMTERLVQAAGVAEVFFGIVFIAFYRVLAINLLNMVALIALLLFVVVFSSISLLAAFNPITTNIPIIALSAILIMELRRGDTHNKAEQ